MSALAYNWKVYSNSNRRVWFDRKARVWFCQTVNDMGDQVGDCDCDARKEMAMRWLQTGNFFPPAAPSASP